MDEKELTSSRGMQSLRLSATSVMAHNAHILCGHTIQVPSYSNMCNVVLFAVACSELAACGLRHLLALDLQTRAKTTVLMMDLFRLCRLWGHPSQNDHQPKQSQSIVI